MLEAAPNYVQHIPNARQQDRSILRAHSEQLFTAVPVLPLRLTGVKAQIITNAILRVSYYSYTRICPKTLL